MYFQLNSRLFSILRKNKQITKDEFFEEQKWKTPFLNSKTGKKYIALFRTFRLTTCCLRTAMNLTFVMSEMIK